MYYKVSICSRGRKCSLCKENIPKDDKFFISYQYDKETMKFPLTENICLSCISKLVDSKFIKYLGELYTQLNSAKKKMLEREQYLKTVPF